MEASTLRNTLAARGITLTKALGQNFLIDNSILERIISYSSIEKGKNYVEVGCGAGVLTRALLEAGATVHGFEIDSRLLRVLKSDFSSEIESGRLVLYEGDALKNLPAVLEELGDYSVVANVPYQITTPLLERFLEPSRFGTYASPKKLTLLVQKELGERITAPAGDSARGFVSVLIEWFGASERVLRVPPSAFEPPPAVDSLVIGILPSRSKEDLEAARPFFSFVRAAFRGRRKQLKNVVAGMRGIPTAEVAALFEQADIPATARAQELTLERWGRLFTEIQGREKP